MHLNILALFFYCSKYKLKPLHGLSKVLDVYILIVINSLLDNTNFTFGQWFSNKLKESDHHGWKFKFFNNNSKRIFLCVDDILKVYVQLCPGFLHIIFQQVSWNNGAPQLLDLNLITDKKSSLKFIITNTEHFLFPVAVLPIQISRYSIFNYLNRL